MQPGAETHSEGVGGGVCPSYLQLYSLFDTLRQSCSCCRPSVLSPPGRRRWTYCRSRSTRQSTERDHNDPSLVPEPSEETVHSGRESQRVQRAVSSGSRHLSMFILMCDCTLCAPLSQRADSDLTGGAPRQRAATTKHLDSRTGSR